MILAHLIAAAVIDPQTNAHTATELFTVDTLFTTGGATTAVFTVTTVLRTLISKLPSRWVAAVLSLVLMIVGIQVKDQQYGVVTILVALINAAVVYAASVGVNNITTAPAGASGAGGAAAPAAPGAPSPKIYRWWV
jgi:uncharacterized membrane protein